jgi:hypothetical protein
MWLCRLARIGTSRVYGTVSRGRGRGMRPDPRNRFLFRMAARFPDSHVGHDRINGIMFHRTRNHFGEASPAHMQLGCGLTGGGAAQRVGRWAACDCACAAAKRTFQRDEVFLVSRCPRTIVDGGLLTASVRIW